MSRGENIALYVARKTHFNIVRPLQGSMFSSNVPGARCWSSKCRAYRVIGSFGLESSTDFLDVVQSRWKELMRLKVLFGRTSGYVNPFLTYVFSPLNPPSEFMK